MPNGFSFNRNWGIHQNAVGYKVDFTEPPDGEDKITWIEKCLFEKLEGQTPKADTFTSTSFKLTNAERDTLIVNWAAFFDAEFFIRGGKQYLKGHNINQGLDFDTPFNRIDGYGSAGEQLIRAFIDKGINIKAKDTWKKQNVLSDIDPEVLEVIKKGFNNNNIGIRFSQPNSFPSCPGKYKIGWSMWEFPKFPTDWVPGANTVNLNFVPCGWNKLLWQTGGVTKPIITIPLGVNESIFKYRKRNNHSDKFVFITDGTILGGFNLIGWFKETFKDKDDIHLIVKERPTGPKRIETDGNVSTISGRLTQEELLDWYYSGNVFLYPTSAEGFGLFPVEAMATGLPVIMTDLPAMRAFCKPELCLTVPVSEIKWYHHVDKSQFMTKMLDVYKHRGELDKIGQRASEFVLKHLTWKAAVDKIIKVLS